MKILSKSIALYAFRQDFFCNVSRVSKIFEADEIQSKMIFKNHMLVAVGVNGASESAQESCLADHGGKPLFVRKRVLFENV